MNCRVNEVLFYIWDPIGVAPEPYARGEYRSYVPVILELVEKNENTQPVSEHLVNIVNNMMALSANKKHCDYIAELLFSHKKAIIEGQS